MGVIGIMSLGLFVIHIIPINHLPVPVILRERSDRNISGGHSRPAKRFFTDVQNDPLPIGLIGPIGPMATQNDP